MDDETRLNQTQPEGNRKFLTAACWFVVVALSFTIRFERNAAIPPFDDLYHLKRIEFSAANFPRVLSFDPDRGITGAFCPWPPLYDLGAAAIYLAFGDVRHLPPIFFSLFAAAICLGGRPPALSLPARLLAALTIAVSPYLINVSRSGAIDHHFVEPLFVLLILTAIGRPVLLAVAVTAALMVQPALIVAAGLAFLCIFVLREGRGGALAFGMAGAAIVAYRLVQPDGYPDSPWFLGYSHALALFGAAVACALRRRVAAPIAMAVGAAIALCSPATLQGFRFFSGDPWLQSIVEFKPMFRDPSRIGTDVANLTGGAILSLTLFRRYPAFAIFASGYLLLALTSRRFLVPAIPLFAIGGALAVAHARTKLAAIAFAASLLLPPLFWHWGAAPEAGPAPYFRSIGLSFKPLPPGRVLAPWSYGHAIDVLGGKAVVLDNFGSAPDPIAFYEANQALQLMGDKTLRLWCARRGIRYVRRQ